MRVNQITGIVFFSIIMLNGLEANAQQESGTLSQLLQLAEKNYPLLKSKMLDVQAAQKGVDISKSTLIPSLDASYQINYGTYNNIVGMSYPQFLIPISGPPSADNNFNGVFGSASSLLLNWQPLTFGQRKAQVDFAKAGLQYATADAQNEIFQHKIKVINAYLDALMTCELVKVYQKNLKRTEANLQALQSLVTSGISPGVDAALFKAEVSKAKVELLNSLKTKEQTSIYLSQLLASDSNISLTDTSYFSKLPLTLLTIDSVEHPLDNLYNSNISIGLARKKILSKTTMPTLGIWSTTYARGSGISNNGSVNAMDGLGFQRYNYGIGFQLSLPILQFAKIRPQLQQQDFLIQSNQEKLNEIELQLKKQNELADSTISIAFAVAKESPLFLESAQFSYRTMLSRYQSGLTNFVDLIQAQYVLVKAETDYKLVYMGVWKAILYKAAVNGNIDLFIKQVN
jgi:outer membrane protein